MDEPNTIDEWITEFRRCVVAQNEAIAKGDPETGNRLAHRYIDAANNLIRTGNTGLAAFELLLGDSAVDVRTMAAAFLIPYKTAESKCVLENSAMGWGTVALGARIALRRWETERKGIDIGHL